MDYPNSQIKQEELKIVNELCLEYSIDKEAFFKRCEASNINPLQYEFETNLSIRACLYAFSKGRCDPDFWFNKEKALRANEDFNKSCKKYKVDPSDYDKIYGRSASKCKQAILEDNFDEAYWFTDKSARYQLNKNKFNQMLIDRGVDPSTYEKTYRRNRFDALILLDQNIEIDISFWLTLGDNPNRQEAIDLFDEELNRRNITKEKFDSVYGGREKVIQELMWGHHLRYENYFSNRVFSARGVKRLKAHEEADQEFERLLKKYNIKGDYGKFTGRKKKDCIKAIASVEEIDENYWFSKRSKRLQENRTVFLKFLKEEGIDITSYESEYRRRIYNAVIQMEKDGDNFNFEDWIKIGRASSRQEIKERVGDLLKNKKLTPEDYRKTYGRPIDSICRELWYEFDKRYQNFYEERVFVNRKETTEEQFATICYKHNFDAQDYHWYIRRNRDKCLDALQSNDFDELFWFTPYTNRAKNFLDDCLHESISEGTSSQLFETLESARFHNYVHYRIIANKVLSPDFSKKLQVIWEANRKEKQDEVNRSPEELQEIIFKYKQENKSRFKNISDAKPVKYVTATKGTELERSALQSRQINEKKLSEKGLFRQSIEWHNEGVAETSICIRCGYKTDKIGSFRRVFAKIAGVKLAPLDRMIKQVQESEKMMKIPFNMQDLDPTGTSVVTSSRAKIKTTSNTLKREKTFRESILNVHGSKCSCCSISIKELVEAAHIVPVSSGGSDSYQNGIPLCPTHHRAFDKHLFTFAPFTKEVIYAEGSSKEVIGIAEDKLHANISDQALIHRLELFQEG